MYSDIQQADDIEFILPNEAREKFFEHEEKVKLVNARITAEGYKTGVKLTTSFPFLSVQVNNLYLHLAFYYLNKPIQISRSNNTIDIFNLLLSGFYS
ncbi:DUF961 family protein [Bacillus safensis]|uniref:DUF961 family protein n=1 Tax=Bacillus safensis TaxID=561879 RepID=UPI003D35B842